MKKIILFENFVDKSTPVETIVDIALGQTDDIDLGKEAEEKQEQIVGELEKISNNQPYKPKTSRSSAIASIPQSPRAETKPKQRRFVQTFDDYGNKT